MDSLLIVALGNLGDMVWAGALAEGLKRETGTPRVGIWVKDYVAEAARFIPGVDEVYAADPFWERSPGRGKGAIGLFLRSLLDVRAGKFDAGVIVNTRWRAAAAVFFAGVPKRVGFGQRGASPFLTDAVGAEHAGKSVLEEWGRLAEPFLGKPLELVPRLRLPETERPLKTEGPVAVLHPFAGDLKRCAPPSFWKDLVPRLRGRGYRECLLIGTSQERKLFGAGPDGALWRETAGLEEVLRTISGADLFVGHDSGPLHVAAGFGVPAVGLFLPGDWPRAKPRGSGGLEIVRAGGPERLEMGKVLEAEERLRTAPGRET